MHIIFVISTFALALIGVHASTALMDLEKWADTHAPEFACIFSSSSLSHAEMLDRVLMNLYPEKLADTRQRCEHASAYYALVDRVAFRAEMEAINRPQTASADAGGPVPFPDDYPDTLRTELDKYLNCLPDKDTLLARLFHPQVWPLLSTSTSVDPAQGTAAVPGDDVVRHAEAIVPALNRLFEKHACGCVFELDSMRCYGERTQEPPHTPFVSTCQPLAPPTVPEPPIYSETPTDRETPTDPEPVSDVTTPEDGTDLTDPPVKYEPNEKMTENTDDVPYDDCNANKECDSDATLGTTSVADDNEAPEEPPASLAHTHRRPDISAVLAIVAGFFFL